MHLLGKTWTYEIKKTLKWNVHSLVNLYNPKEKETSICKIDKLIIKNPCSFIIFPSDTKRT